MTTALPVLPTKTAIDNPLTPNQIAERLTGRGYLSYSAISTYQRCPLRYLFSYIEGRTPEFKSSSLVFGGAIHTAIELHFRKAFEGIESPSINELLEAYDHAWKNDATTPIRYGKSETAEVLRDLANRMLSAFLGSEVSKLDSELLGVEEEFKAPIIPDCPDLLGRIDLVKLTKDRVKIIDFKTSRSSWNHAKVQESATQQLLYSELVKPLAEVYGHRLPEIEWAVLTKGKSPRVEIHRLQPDTAQIERVKAMVHGVWTAIKAQHFYPVPSTMNCSGCPFQTPCGQWEG